MEQLIKQIQQNYQKLANFYGEDPKQVQSDEFFSKINRIWLDCQNARVKIVQQREAEKRKQ
jgi:diaphanous 1